jgi:hypothetical protein
MLIERKPMDSLVENCLPDGSRVIVDRKNETVIALNATAGAAWDACSAPTTLSAVREKMRRSVGDGVTDEVAEEAISQLQERNLLTTTGSAPRTRRQVLATLSAVALPLVVCLTLTDQRAHAKTASSTTAPPPASPPPQCGFVCQILKGLGL